MFMIELVLTSLVVGAALKVWWSRGQERCALGAMSQQWMAECRTGRPTPE